MLDSNGFFRLTPGVPCQHRTKNNPRPTLQQKAEVASRQKDNTLDRPAWAEAAALRKARAHRLERAKARHHV